MGTIATKEFQTMFQFSNPEMQAEYEAELAKQAELHAERMEDTASAIQQIKERS